MILDIVYTGGEARRGLYLPQIRKLASRDAAGARRSELSRAGAPGFPIEQYSESQLMYFRESRSILLRFPEFFLGLPHFGRNYRILSTNYNTFFPSKELFNDLVQKVRLF